MMPQYKIIFNFLVTILLSSVVGGCAAIDRSKPTKPNIPYKGPYPESFKAIEENNPLLAKEIGKLPEIQDGISPVEAKALDEIADFYKNFPEHFDRSFTNMYRVGLPEARKYCSPL